MKLSKKCEYALKVLVELSQGGQRAMNLRELSARCSVPVKFLEQIMLVLKNAGWVLSLRGKDGGYSLGVPAGDIPVSEVIRRVDGMKNHYLPYLERDHYLSPDERYSGIYHVLSEAHQNMESSLEKVSVEDLCRRAHELTEARSGQYMYYI